VLAICFTVSTIVITASGAESQDVILSCPLAGRVGQDPEVRFDRTFKVDYAKGTVDGVPVTISESSIRWLSNDKRSSTEINRYTGSVVVRMESSGRTLLSGKCVPVSQRQF
jgi:hypothetical protein